MHCARLALLAAVCRAAAGYVAPPPTITLHPAGRSDGWHLTVADESTVLRALESFRDPVVSSGDATSHHFVTRRDTCRAQGTLLLYRYGSPRLVAHFWEREKGAAHITSIATRWADSMATRAFFSMVESTAVLSLDSAILREEQPRWMLAYRHHRDVLG